MLRLLPKHCKAIRDSVSYNYGDLGFAKTVLSLQVKYINAKTRIAIIRVAREYIDIIWTSITLMTSFLNRKTKFRILHCSGTIKKIEIKAKEIMINWLNEILKDSNLKKEIQLELTEQNEKEIKELEKIEQ